MSPYLKLLLVVLLSVGVSACGKSGRKSKPVIGAESSATQQIELKSADNKPKVVDEGDKVKEEELTALDHETALLPPKIDDNPEKLLGIDAQQLVEILGDPSLIRNESPAEIWQYSTKSCVLDLVLYDAKTTYIEARDEHVRPMDSRKCLRILLLSRKN
ncbi:hypothetical protein [Kiloniella antarctica]|uniref:Lipoprotein SmpA/OmlA domain-containing protein n=1 Tax=Kiloniella antarctica TaxID=1550907 RepID=A0ABW5BI61_9PROT